MAKFNIESNIGEVSGAFGTFASRLTGPVVSAIKGVNVALATLAANPIGAVVAALGIAVIALTAGLSKLQPVVDAIEVRLARAGAAMSFFVDTVGSWLGLNDAPALSLSETKDAAAALTVATQNAADAQNELIVRSSELRAEAKEALLVSADQTLSTDERVAALNRAGDAIREQFRLEREFNEENIRIIEGRRALGTNTREEDMEYALLLAMRNDLIGAEATMLKEVEGQTTGLIKAQNTLIQQQQDASQKEVDRVRELRQEREIDLAIAGGATEEEVFQLRLERAETQEEMDAINHEKEIARIEGIRDAKAEADEAEMEMADALMKQEESDAADAAKLNEQSLANTEIANEAKMASNLAVAEAAVNALTSLLGDSKGAMIAGLVASNAFEVASILVADGKGRAAATAAAAPLLANPVTAVAGAASLTATQAAIAASTTAGLVGVGIATATGIAGILASPGEKPSEGGSGGGGASAPPAGPTVETPNVSTPQVTNPDGSVGGAVVTMGQGTVLLTPTSGPGSLASTIAANDKRMQRRRF